MSDQASYNKRWKDYNKDRIKEYNQKRYIENKEDLQQKMAVWRSANKEKIKSYNKKKRSDDDVLYIQLKEPKFIYKIIHRNFIENFKK
jgi:hypothetical protein